MPAYLAFMMLAIGAMSFLYNRLFSLLTESLSFTLPADSIYVAIAIVPAMLAFASLRAWGDRSVKAVMYLSLALYLPSVIGVSRIDLLNLAAGRFTKPMSPADIAAKVESMLIEGDVIVGDDAAAPDAGGEAS
jgi:hypothetical protein